MVEKPVLGIIGAGKVGTVLGRLWYGTGYRITAVHSRTLAHAEALAATVKAQAVQHADEVVGAADLTLLTVPDDVIGQAAGQISGGSLHGKGVIHTSGAKDAGVLSTLAVRGAMTGSLHPAYPVADVEAGVNGLPGAAFAVEAEAPELQQWLTDLVDAVQGRVMVIPAGGKAAYHSALVFASNYTVTLYAAAERLMTGLGIEREAADQALNALVSGTVENLRQQGIPKALTGPLARGDTGTVVAHLAALRQIDPALAGLYKQLARATYPLLTERNIAIDAIDEILRMDDNHAADYP